MPIGQFSAFDAYVPPNPPISNGQDVPKEMDIFFRPPSDFIPEGKTWEDLTPEEKKLAQDRYRFSPYRPGVYQGITGVGGMA